MLAVEEPCFLGCAMFPVPFLSTTLAFLTDDVDVRPRVMVAVRGPPERRWQGPEHTLAVLERAWHICPLKL